MKIELNSNTILLLQCVAIGISLLLITYPILIGILFRKLKKRATREDLESQINLLREEIATTEKSLISETTIRIKDGKDLLKVISADRRELLEIISEQSNEIYVQEGLNSINKRNIAVLEDEMELLRKTDLKRKEQIFTLVEKDKKHEKQMLGILEMKQLLIKD